MQVHKREHIQERELKIKYHVLEISTLKITRYSYVDYAIHVLCMFAKRNTITSPLQLIIIQENQIQKTQGR